MSLEIRKLEVELLRVSAAKAEMDLRIYERLDEIERLKEQIIIQEKREIELKTKLTGLKK